MSEEPRVLKYIDANEAETSFIKQFSQKLISNKTFMEEILKTRLPYRTRAFLVKNPEMYKLKEKYISVRKAQHKGQTKLFVSEFKAICKLLKSGYDVKNIVYVGAAPGTHIVTLLKFFPDITFHLFDPAKFDDTLLKYPTRVKIYQKIFESTEYCNGLSGLFFISDIRTGSVVESDSDEFDKDFEENVKADMELQKRWIEELKCPALVKFRLPYTDGKNDIIVPYFRGEFIYAPFSRYSSSEGRLLITEFIFIDYSSIDWENQMYTLNYARNIVATDKFIPELREVYPNICSCIDCTTIVKMFERYVSMEITGVSLKNCFKILIDTTHQRLADFHGLGAGKPTDFSVDQLYLPDMVKMMVDIKNKKELHYKGHTMPLAKHKV